MQKLTVLVCDDEAMARKRTLRLLSENDTIEYAVEADSAAAAQAQLEEHDIEVLFLDIQMPGQTGMEFAKTLQAPRPHIVFVTAHAEHALDAFDVGAVDYLVKPIDAEKLDRCLARVLERRKQGPARGGQPVQPDAPLAVKTREGAELLRRADIAHATFDGALVTLALVDGRQVLTELTLVELEQRLPAFLRVHRRSLLALEHVTRLASTPSGGYVAHMRGGGQVEVSRQSARDLRRELGLT
jgi:two-component system, LytTR family, response regulator